jgi:hypothetical protein
VYQGKERGGQTAIGFKVITPTQTQSWTNCWKQALYWGKDNAFYLSQNSKRLREWIQKTRSEGSVVFQNKKIPVVIILVADWMALEAGLRSKWCHYCSIEKHENEKPLSPNNLPWHLEDGDSVPKDAVLPIPRKNVFLCFFHADKRIVETFLNRLLVEWSKLPEKTQNEAASKYHRLKLFQDWLAELGVPYTFAMEEKRPSKLDLEGGHVRKIVASNSWERAVQALNADPKWINIWKVQPFEWDQLLRAPPVFPQIEVL